MSIDIIILGVIIVISILSVSFLIIGISTKIGNKKRVKECTVKADGEIVEIKKVDMSASNENMAYSWFPVVKYQVGDRTITERFNYGNAKPKYEIGQKVEIYYNPHKVEEFYISGEDISKIIGRVFTLTGGLLLLIDIIIVIIFAIVK